MRCGPPGDSPLTSRLGTSAVDRNFRCESRLQLPPQHASMRTSRLRAQPWLILWVDKGNSSFIPTATIGG